MVSLPSQLHSTSREHRTTSGDIIQHCDLPQDSVLGLPLFIPCTAHLENTARRHGLRVHFNLQISPNCRKTFAARCKVVEMDNVLNGRLSHAKRIFDNGCLTKFVKLSDFVLLHSILCPGFCNTI